MKQQEISSLATLLLHPLIGPSLLRLFQSGVSEQDIVAISELFKADSRIGINVEEDSAITHISNDASFSIRPSGYSNVIVPAYSVQ